jgi:hypothetical protein
MANNFLEGRQDAKENNCKFFRKLAEENNIEKWYDYTEHFVAKHRRPLVGFTRIKL